MVPFLGGRQDTAGARPGGELQCPVPLGGRELSGACGRRLPPGSLLRDRQRAQVLEAHHHPQRPHLDGRQRGARRIRRHRVDWSEAIHPGVVHEGREANVGDAQQQVGAVPLPVPGLDHHERAGGQAPRQQQGSGRELDGGARVGELSLRAAGNVYRRVGAQRRQRMLLLLGPAAAAGDDGGQLGGQLHCREDAGQVEGQPPAGLETPDVHREAESAELPLPLLRLHQVIQGAPGWVRVGKARTGGPGQGGNPRGWRGALALLHLPQWEGKGAAGTHIGQGRLGGRVGGRAGRRSPGQWAQVDRGGGLRAPGPLLPGTRGRRLELKVVLVERLLFLVPLPLLLVGLRRGGDVLEGGQALDRCCMGREADTSARRSMWPMGRARGPHLGRPWPWARPLRLLAS